MGPTKQARMNLRSWVHICGAGESVVQMGTFRFLHKLKEKSKKIVKPWIPVAKLGEFNV